MTSIERPSRRVRPSATAMRYWGLRILPSRVSLIFTAMVKRFLLYVSRCNSATRAGCRGPVLPRVCDRRAARSRAADSRLLCQNEGPRKKCAGNPARSHHLLEDLGFDPPRHPPTLGRAHELVVVPEPAEKHLVAITGKHHRVEADDARRGGIPI